MQKLVISDDEGQTTVVPLVWDELTIGRAPGNTIRLTERNVSRQHARLRRDATGAYVLEDLGSYMGVRVNDEPVDAPRALAPGDRIGIGDYALELRDQASEADAPPDRRTTARHRVDRTESPPEPTPEPPVAAPPAAPARLVLLSQPAPGAEFALSGERLRVGRTQDLEVWINHRSISRVHAEVAATDEGWVIRDAGSANGIRVNGRRVESARLAPGDVLDLGQVRLRFVAPGEDYRFELDRTVELARAPVRSGRPGRGVVVGLGLGLAGIAAAAGLALVDRAAPGTPPGGAGASAASAPVTTAAAAEPPSASGPGAPDGPVATGDAPAAPPVPGAGDVDPAGPGGAVGDGADRDGAGAAGDADREGAAVVGCEAALEAQAWEAAREAAARGPATPALDACGERAARRIAERGTFERALERLRSGDVAGAHFALGGLPADSPYRARPEAAEVFRERASAELERLARLGDGDPAAALRGLDALLAVPGLDPGARRRARRLRGDLAVAAPAASPEPAGGGSERADGLR